MSFEPPGIWPKSLKLQADGSAPLKPPYPYKASAPFRGAAPDLKIHSGQPIEGALARPFIPRSFMESSTLFDFKQSVLFIGCNRSVGDEHDAFANSSVWNGGC